MNKAMRWRIISLQAIMVVVLAGAAAFAYGMGTFTTTQIHDELAAQQVYFPDTDQIRAGGALDPAKFSQEIRDQAGNQVTDGNQARIYANDFVGEHLKGVAGGLSASKLERWHTLGAHLDFHEPGGYLGEGRFRYDFSGTVVFTDHGLGYACTYDGHGVKATIFIVPGVLLLPLCVGGPFAPIAFQHRLDDEIEENADSSRWNQGASSTSLFSSSARAR